MKTFSKFLKKIFGGEIGWCCVLILQRVEVTACWFICGSSYLLSAVYDEFFYFFPPACYVVVYVCCVIWSVLYMKCVLYARICDRSRSNTKGRGFRRATLRSCVPASKIWQELRSRVVNVGWNCGTPIGWGELYISMYIHKSWC
jgi:hypothetical protein